MFEIKSSPTLAASVILLRESAQGVEILLQLRPRTAAILGGIWVFPGGKVEQADQVDPNNPHSFATAAARELREETGVLLPSNSAASLRAWARWRTPERPVEGPYRFDTVFFIAPLPEGQTAHSANAESDATRWLSAEQALAQHAQGLLPLMPPQYILLWELAQFTHLEEIWSAGSDRPLDPILPTVHTLQNRALDSSACIRLPATLLQRLPLCPPTLHYHQGQIKPYPAGEQD